MSNYGRWFQNSSYESGYGNSTGKRKRDEFTIGGNSGYGGGSNFGTSSGSYGSGSSFGSGSGFGSASGFGSGSGFSSGSGLDSGYGGGSDYGSSGMGYGGSSRFGSGSSFGGSSSGYSGSSSNFGGGVGGSGYSRTGTSSYGNSNYDNFNSNSNDKYDNFLSNQSVQMNEMSKKLRKMEMMQQIAELEMEGDEEEKMLRHRLESLQQQKRMRGMVGNEMNRNFGGSGGAGGYRGGYRGGYGGRRPLMDPPMRGHRNERYRGGGMNNRRGGQGGMRGRTDGYGGRRDRKPPPQRQLQNKRPMRNTNQTKRSPIRNAPRTTIRPINTTGRDGRLKKLMEKMKTFKDKADATATLHYCIKVTGVNIDVFYYQKFGCLYLDGVLFGRGLAKPYKELAYKEAIYKLRNCTLDKVYEQAKQMGKLADMPTEKETSKKPSEEINILVSPLEFSEMPFDKRLELLAEQVKVCKHISVCLKLYCTKYMINLMSCYRHLDEEPIDKHEFSVYANSVFLASAKGRLRKRVEYEALKNVQDLFMNKTIAEIMENDGRFEEDFKDGFPEVVNYRGCGNQVETNAMILRITHNITDLDTIKDKPIDDLILFEKNLWRGSKFRMLEESASRCKMLSKWVWEVENPEEWQKEEPAEEKESANSEKKEEEEKMEDDEDGNKANGKDQDEKYMKTNYGFDPASKRKEVIDQAKEKKCNIISCKVYLRDKEYGYGFGTTRNQATRMASAAAIRELSTTQSMVYHTDQDPSSSNKVYKYEELRKRAETLKEKRPEPPTFEKIRNEDLYDRDEVMDENAEEDMLTEIADDEVADKKEEAEDELAPWIKEIVRQDMEELSNVDFLIEKALTYLEIPKYIRDLAGHYCPGYKLNHKSKFQHKKLMALNIQKQPAPLEDIVERLMKEPGKKAYGFTLQQIRKEDGTVEVLNKLNINRKQKRRHYEKKK